MKHPFIPTYLAKKLRNVSENMEKKEHYESLTGMRCGGALLPGHAQDTTRCIHLVAHSLPKYMSQRNRGRDEVGVMCDCVYHSILCGKRKSKATWLHLAREINK